MDLPNDAQILSIMTRPSSLEQLKQFLQIDDDTVKVNCFKLLHHIMCRTFDKEVTPDFTSMSSSNNSFNKETSKSDEMEL